MIAMAVYHFSVQVTGRAQGAAPSQPLPIAWASGCTTSGWTATMISQAKSGYSVICMPLIVAYSLVI